MAKVNITEALLFSRSYPDSAREILFRQLIKISLGEKKDGNTVEELAFLPLEPNEETWFEEFLTNGEGKSMKKAKDTLLVHKIANNRFQDAGRHKSSGQWAPILEGIRAGTDGYGE